MNADVKKYLARVAHAEYMRAERYRKGKHHQLWSLEMSPTDSVEADEDGNEDESKFSDYSDNGKGTQAIYDAVSAHLDGEPIDGFDEEAERIAWRRKYHNAIVRIQREKPECLPCFLLINKFGKNRKATIWTMMQRGMANSSKHTAKNTKLPAKNTSVNATPCSTSTARIGEKSPAKRLRNAKKPTMKNGGVK